MYDVIMTKIVPVNSIFVIGYMLKNRKILRAEDGGIFLKVAFYILIPAMLFNSTRKMDISWGILIYPGLIAVVQTLMNGVGRLLYSVSGADKTDRPVVVSSLMVMNAGFIIPFFIAFYGQEEVWRVGLFDFGNALITFSVTYSIFLNAKTGGNRLDFKKTLSVLKSPPVIAIFLGFIFNFLKLGTPKSIDILAGNLTTLIGPMIMMALGLYFNPRVPQKLLTLSIIITKFVVGGITATILSNLFGLTGATKAVMYLMACSPVGTNILTFSMLSDSDMSLASGIVSLSTLLNLFLIPALLMYLTL